MTFDWLYHPADWLDAWASSGLPDAGPVLVVVLAVALGARHATDPDHLMAVGALVSAGGAGPRDAARLGAWWGAGHALTLLVVGLPLIAWDTRLPSWLEGTAETTIGLLIVALALRMLWRLRTAQPSPRRSPVQAAGIGILHGLGGTGTVVLLFAASLPDPEPAALALTVFAAMSAVSMAVCTGAWGWALSRPATAVACERYVLPAGALVAVAFGCWYAGLAA